VTSSPRSTARQVTDAEQLEVLSISKSPGDRVRLTYRRGEAAADAVVTLAAQPVPAR
jgi:hypothetical protein